MASKDWGDDTYRELKRSCGDVFIKIGAVFSLFWGRTSRRIRFVIGFVAFCFVLLWMWQPTRSDLPSISLEYSGTHHSPYNESRVALLIENRANPILAPLVLHFMSVVPPDWRFRFMGSNVSVPAINSSAAIREMVKIGKLDLTYIPANMTTNSQEEISRFLTNRWIYETVLQPAEHLLVFQTDSMICANSQQSINEWLEYDWVGAPWNPNGKWGGNGGLSLRKVSAILDILRNQVRTDKMPEDVWLAERLANRPGAKMANGTASLTFSGEMHGGEVVKIARPDAPKIPDEEREKHDAGGGIDSDATEAAGLAVDLWRDGFYEPMGYHTGDNGRTMHSAIWGTPEMRAHIWQYCPEVKLIFEMDAAEYVPGACQTNWKRDLSFAEMTPIEEPEMVLKKRWDPNNVDENGYPYLPENLMPW